jgi:Tol biopolymer transport system component
MHQAGTRLGPYEITAGIGAGGMGEVYKARDTRLDRVVAVKVLPPDFASDAGARQRFEREARIVASLNHPHICTLYDVGHADGTDFLVMEYLEGETLAARLTRGKLPLDQALRHGIEIAGAVAAAHAAGIVHRDLKPGNIMLTKQGTKLLDFGLAKGSEVAIVPDEVTRSGGVHTRAGTILGTVGYMSPEQAEGKALDARSDIFSVGTILYEMVTGQRAFRGDSSVATLAAILDKEPPPLEPGTPHALQRVVSRCLRKDPDARYQHMSDVRIALEELEDEVRARKPTTDGPPRSRRLAALGLALVAVVALVAATLVWRLARPGRQGSAPLDVVPLTSSAGAEEEPGFSPDGRQVAFAWDGESQDNYDIYVKLIGAPKPLRLTTDPAEDHSPVFSPDGQSIGFTRVSNGRLRYVVIPAIGGGERVVADLGPDTRDPTSPFGWTCSSTWLRDGTSVIVDGLKRVSLETGEVRALSSRSGVRLTGWYPAVHPGGRILAFARPSSNAVTALYLIDVSDRGEPAGEPRAVMLFDGDVSGIAWAADGRHLVFSGGRLSGSSGTSKVLWRVAATEGAQPERLPFGEGANSPAISPAGDRLAFVRTTLDVSIWRARLGDGTTAAAAARFVSSTRDEWSPQYSPDGKRLAFESNRTGESAIWVGDADGSNLVEVFSRAGKHSGTPRWAPDNERLAFDSTAEGTSFDIYVIRVGSAQPARLTTHPADDAMPSWAPDGRWIYFGSKRTGRWEVWKVPATGGEATQVTRNGGSCVYPSVDGTRIYYTKQDGDSALWSMPVTGGAEIQVLPSVVGRAFAVFADGIYFVPHADPTGRHAVHFLTFATGVASPVVSIADYPGLGLAVSPDRREILYPLGDAAGRDLMLVDGFR